MDKNLSDPDHERVTQFWAGNRNDPDISGVLDPEGLERYRARLEAKTPPDHRKQPNEDLWTTWGETPPPEAAPESTEFPKTEQVPTIRAANIQPHHLQQQNAAAEEVPARKKSSLLTSKKLLAVVGGALALNLAAVGFLIFRDPPPPETLTAEVVDSDEYADEDFMRIEVPLNPETDGSGPTGEAAPSGDVNSNLEPLQMVITEGKLVLRGTATSEDQADQMISDARKVFPEVELVEKYVVDSTAPPPSRGVVVQKPVVFEPGSAVIREEFYPILDACADVMRLNPTLVMNVSGHTDSDGSAEYNLKLAEARADAVIDYYVGVGLEREQFALVAAGEGSPINTNDSEEGKQDNRRTDLEFEGVFDEVIQQSN